MLNEKNIKAIYVNATTQEIKEVVINNFKHIRELIGNYCTFFSPVMLNENNDIFCDDAGLNKNPEHFVFFKGLPNPLAGNILIVGWNGKEAETIDTTLSVEWAKENVVFMNKRDVQIWALSN